MLRLEKQALETKFLYFDARIEPAGRPVELINARRYTIAEGR